MLLLGQHSSDVICHSSIGRQNGKLSSKERQRQKSQVERGIILSDGGSKGAKEWIEVALSS